MEDALTHAAQRLAVEVDGVPIPSVYWPPAGGCSGIVLACHGGSGHKLSPAILAIVGACLPRGLAVLAIDGPVHGERRADGDLDPQRAVRRFREAWQAGIGHDSMARDMAAALDALLRQPRFAGLPVAYVGVSMGTGYGLPLLAAEPRIAAAAIGLWGMDFPRSEHLLAHARAVRCPVWFTQQWDDQTFSREGTAALFDAIGAPDKRLVAYPGPHRELEGERLQDAIRFLEGRLKADRREAAPAG